MKKGILILTFVLMLIGYLNTNEVMAACREGDSACEQRARELAESDAELAARDATSDAKKAAGTSNDPISESAKGITAAPTTKVTKMADGSESRIVTVPGNDTYSSVGTITRPDGTVDKVTTFKGDDGSTITEITKPDGTTATAKQSADGTFSSDSDPYAKDSATAIQNGSDQLITITSEKVPGATCNCQKGADCTKVETRKYECISGKGLTGFQQVFAQIIRYVINIVLLLGVLAVAGLGVAWSFAGGDDIKMKSTLKKWAINIIIGLVILFMFGYILRFLAPWVYV